VADVADALKVRRNLVSDCVSSQEGCTFSTFVNKYRVEYAKQLLSQHPDMKINTIGNESGFANDTSFFRTFKAITGMTPSEWKGQID
jgi:YesN/AraC family two-component response regulator